MNILELYLHEEIWKFIVREDRSNPPHERLKKVKKQRRRRYVFTLNGRSVVVSRSDLKSYLENIVSDS